MSGGRHPGIGIVWPPPVPMDPDAAAYIARVEAADGQALEANFKAALSDLVVYAKATTSAAAGGGTLWSRVSNWILFSGPRTVTGAMVVPLRGGVQPVGVNLTAGLHTRRGGIVGTPTLRIATGVALPAGFPIAGGVFQTAPTVANYGGSYWVDSSSPQVFVLGMGGGTTVTPSDSAFFVRVGDTTSNLIIGEGINLPHAPMASTFIGAVSVERTANTTANTAWDLVRGTAGMTSRANAPADPTTARLPIHMYSRPSGAPAPGEFRLGGFIQGSLLARECNDLLNRYQAAVTAHVP